MRVSNKSSSCYWYFSKVINLMKRDWISYANISYEDITEIILNNVTLTFTQPSRYIITINLCNQKDLNNIINYRSAVYMWIYYNHGFTQHHCDFQNDQCLCVPMNISCCIPKPKTAEQCVDLFLRNSLETSFLLSPACEFSSIASWAFIIIYGLLNNFFFRKCYTLNCREILLNYEKKNVDRWIKQYIVSLNGKNNSYWYFLQAQTAIKKTSSNLEPFTLKLIPKLESDDILTFLSRTDGNSFNGLSFSNVSILIDYWS